MSIKRNDIEKDLLQVNEVLKRNIDIVSQTFLQNSQQRAPRGKTGDLIDSGRQKTSVKGNYYSSEIYFGEGIGYARRRYNENKKNPKTKQWMDKEYKQNEKLYDMLITKGIGD